MYRSTEGTVLLEESGSELVALYGFNEKRAHRVKFFIQNVQNEIQEICEMFRNNMKFTRTTCYISSRDSNSTLRYFYVVTIVGHYYGVITEGL